MSDRSPQTRERWTIHNPDYEGGIPSVVGPAVNGTREVVPAVVTDKMVERACAAQWGEGQWPDVPNAAFLRREMQAALRAALEVPE